MRRGKSLEEELAEGWSRSESTGDVRNLRAFNAHMDQVGEEDQSAPEWEEGA